MPWCHSPVPLGLPDVCPNKQQQRRCWYSSASAVIHRSCSLCSGAPAMARRLPAAPAAGSPCSPWSLTVAAPARISLPSRNSSLCPSPRPTARLPDAHVSAPARLDLAVAYPLRRAPGPGLSPPTPHGAPALLLQRRVPPHLLCSLQLAEAPSRAPLQPWPRLSCSGSLASAAAPSSVVPGSSLVLAWLRPLALDHGGRPWPCSVFLPAALDVLEPA